jgi:hypothetical protein
LTTPLLSPAARSGPAGKVSWKQAIFIRSKANEIFSLVWDSLLSLLCSSLIGAETAMLSYGFHSWATVEESERLLCARCRDRVTDARFDVEFHLENLPS